MSFLIVETIRDLLLRTIVVSLATIVIAAGAFAAPNTAEPNKAEPSTAGSPVSRPETVIVFIGDSLTQGYGVRAEDSYPEQVGRMLREKGFAVKIINGGISGSVTAEADRRLRWYLKAKPAIVVLALGANDGMKGTPPEVIENNLRKAILLAQENKIQIVLGGLRMFTNLGEVYLKKFESLFPRLAKEKGVALIPFLLEDVALQKELNQSDMRHPNPAGHLIIAKRVAEELERLLPQASPKKAPKTETKVSP